MTREIRTIIEPVTKPDAFDQPLSEESNGAKATVLRAELSLDHFKPLIGGHITIVGANGRASFDLTEGCEKPKSKYPGQKRMPFSLILRSPAGVALGGDHYDLVHPDLGTIPYVLLTQTLSYPDQPPGSYFEIKFT